MNMEKDAAVALFNKALDYEIVGKKLVDMWKIIAASPDYSQFNIGLKPQDPVYVCIGYRRGNGSKLPNLTYVPDHAVIYKPTIEEVLLFGDTKGHHQDMPGKKRMQELYEYHGFGAMVIDNDGKETINFVFAKPGDKIAVPNQCHMTIYNLDTVPLNTADFANPNKKSLNYNAANKEMQNQIGPVFCIYQNWNEVVFKFNEKYVNSDNELVSKYGSGVKLINYLPEDLEIRLDVGAGEGLGKRLYDRLSKDETRQVFAKIGVNLIQASEEVEMVGVRTKQSLLEIIGRDDKVLQKYFRLI